MREKAFRAIKRSREMRSVAGSEQTRRVISEASFEVMARQIRRYRGKHIGKLTLLSEVNKMIFVQDFIRAGRMLKALARRYPADYEVHFRRIEVACRTTDLEEVFHEYTSRALTNPQIIALQFASTLAEIRLMEQRSAEKKEGGHLVNPSLRGESLKNDVMGLSSSMDSLFLSGTVRSSASEANALLAQSILDTEPRFGARAGSRLLSAPHLGEHGENSKQALSKSGLFRVAREPSFADDIAIPDVPVVSEVYADFEPFAEDFQMESSHHTDTLPCVRQALEYSRLYQGNYAAWFVAGCALEFEGKLEQAIEAWSRSVQLNPNSCAILATMAELQQMGAIPEEGIDYSTKFESLDRFLVHGTFDTHMEIYRQYMGEKRFTYAISALRTLADWVQRQRGFVPPEIEVLCLLGAMKAYAEQGNNPASDSCRKEAENLVIGCKKSDPEASQLSFLGQICEEFGLKALARMCYLSVLVSVDAKDAVLVQTAAHLVSTSPSMAVKESLKVAYRNTKGNAEIRFCQLLCVLSLEKIPVKFYMDRKNRARQYLAQGEVGEAFPLLNEAANETSEDAEVHYYLAEILQKMGALEQAAKHYEAMYALDFFNSDSVVHYLYFLLKNQDYLLVRKVCREAMDRSIQFSSGQKAEVHWACATALFAEKRSAEAQNEILRALSFDPWSSTYISLALRLYEPEQYGTNLPSEKILQEIEPLAIEQKEVPEELLSRWIERGRHALLHGYCEYSYLMAKFLFMISPRSEIATDFFCRASAAFGSRAAAQQVLLLSAKTGSSEMHLSQLATLIARVYSHSGEWELVEEWIDIAVKSGVDDKGTRSKLFELEALKLTITGANLRKAQNLLEAAIDSIESGQNIPSETGVLHGYILLVQGNIKVGMEKMQHHIGQGPSIQSLYFLVKGLERAGRLDGKEKESLARFFTMLPTNSLEQKLIEEIYCTIGFRRGGAGVSLSC
jgi:tetratricopeptide (TPR) repeat protein